MQHPMNPLLHNMLMNYQNMAKANHLMSLFYQGQFQAPITYAYPQPQFFMQPPFNPFQNEDLLFLTPPKPISCAKTHTIEVSDDLESASLKTEDSSCKLEISEQQAETPFKHEESEPIKPISPLKSQILNIVYFMLNEHGKAKTEEVKLRRQLYIHNESLLQLFDCLDEKFSLAAKCREDMVRFVLRKAISSLRDSLRHKMKISAKAASLELCKKYFSARAQECTKNLESEEDLLNFLLPYKKNSRNKTANTKFMNEIFSSGDFYEDYKEYLSRFDKILESENQKKVEKFANFLETCVQKNSFKEIKNYKRLPWLKVWLEATKIIAYELLNNNNNTSKTEKIESQSTKKVKTQTSKSSNKKSEEN